MKVIHVTFGMPPYSSGGLPLYVEGLIREQIKSGYEVIILEPGSIQNCKNKIKKVAKNKYRIYPALPVPYNFGVDNANIYTKKFDKTIYENFLRKINPDVIHVHSIMGIHKEFFECAKKLKIKIVMTTHDCYGICLRSNMLNSDNVACDGPEVSKCAKCNYCRGLSKSKIKIMQTDFYKTIKPLKILKGFRRNQRTKQENNKICITNINKTTIDEYSSLLNYYREILNYIDYFIYNSEITKEIYQKHIHCKGEIVQILLPDIKKHDFVHSKIEGKIKIGYIGRAEEYKGVKLLLSSIKNIDNAECYLYGDDYSQYATNEKIHNCGKFNRDELKKIFENINILVVPSVCFETFGFTVLEAMSYNIPVLVSSKVGAKFLLEGCPFNVIFEPTSENLTKNIQEINSNELLEKYSKWIFEKKLCYDMKEHLKIIENIYAGKNNE